MAHNFVTIILQKQIARFLLVGAFNAVFGYVAFLVLYYALHESLHYNIVLAISYIISVTNSFLLQRRFVFKSRARACTEFMRFNLVNLSGMLVNMGLLSLSVNFVTNNIPLAQAVSLLGTIAFIYVGHQLFSFRKNALDPDDTQPAR